MVKKLQKISLKLEWLNEVFSIGHRNPQGLIINSENNTIWSHEHGPQGGDEINLLEGGENYGWPEVTHGEEYGGGKIGKLTKKVLKTQSGYGFHQLLLQEWLFIMEKCFLN